MMVSLFKKVFQLKTKLLLSEIKALRVKLFFNSTQTLEKSLEQIATILQQKNAATILVQVIYRTEQIEQSNAILHFNFMQNHPNLSTYLPLCLPIFDETFRLWATPQNCQTCIFFEGKRCDGLGNPLNFIQNLSIQFKESENYLLLKNQPTMILSEDQKAYVENDQSLFSVEQDQSEQEFEIFDIFTMFQTDNSTRHSPQQHEMRALENQTGALMDLSEIFQKMDQNLDLALYQSYFEQNPPLAYWQPQSIHIEAIINSFLRNQVKMVWDIGGGNGFLSEYLSRRLKHHTKEEDQEEICFQVIDPVDIYSSSKYIQRITKTIENHLLSFRLHPVDALIISWPPAGNGFDEVIELLNPKVVIYAYDGEGFCGRQKGSFYAEWIDAKAYFFEHQRIDFLVKPQRPHVQFFEVKTYREHQAQQRENFKQKGILAIHSEKP